MPNTKLTVFARLSAADRDLILQMAPRSLPNVYCYGITYAYGVERGFTAFPNRASVVIVGIHRTGLHEALLRTVNDRARRPDGKMFHVTLSVADGIAPATAGDIDAAAIVPIVFCNLDLRFAVRQASVMQPQRESLAVVM